MANLHSRQAVLSKMINRRYFLRLLEDRGLTQRDLARRLKLDPSAVSLGLAGKRKFSTGETAQLARVLEVPLDDVLRNLSVDVPRMRRGGHVPVVGEVKLKGEIQYGQSQGAKSVPVPPNETPDGMQALYCTVPGVLYGAYLYFRPSADVPPEAIGRLCICVRSAGALVAATVQHGAMRETYNLIGLDGVLLYESTWLEAASPVLWIKAS